MAHVHMPAMSRHDHMFKVGLTGGIGSGKSTVARVFEVLGIPVFHADDEGKRILSEDPRRARRVIEAFGAGDVSERTA